MRFKNVKVKVSNGESQPSYQSNQQSTELIVEWYDSQANRSAFKPVEYECVR